MGVGTIGGGVGAGLCCIYGIVKGVYDVLFYLRGSGFIENGDVDEEVPVAGDGVRLPLGGELVGAAVAAVVVVAAVGAEAVDLGLDKGRAFAA